MVDYARAVRERVGRNVKRLRDKEQWTQDELAEKVGNTWRHISQIERGQVNVGLDILAKIAEATSVDVAEVFVNDTPSPEDPPGSTIVSITPDDLTTVAAAQAVLARLTQTARDLNETASSLALQEGGSSTVDPEPAAPKRDDPEEQKR